MRRFLLIRLAQTAAAVWGLATVVFLLSRYDLASSEQLLLPDTSDQTNNHGGMAPAAQQAAQLAIRQRLGLNLPLFYVSRTAASTTSPAYWQWHGHRNQYHIWAGQLRHGNLGVSFRSGQPVTAELLSALAYTVPLTGTAVLLTLVLAVVLGQGLAAERWWQQPVRMLLLGGQTLPLFAVAFLLLLLFANPAVLAWFPAYGLEADMADNPALLDRLATYALHLVLPLLSLVLTALPDLTLQLEAALAKELRTDYAMTARAKGLPERQVVRQHALRNALLPTLTQFTELLPALVAGAVVVEVIFAVPGMGRLLAEAAARRDYPMLTGGVLLLGATRLFSLLLADLLYYWADPRIRWQP